MQGANVRAANQAWESLMTAHARLTAGFASEDMWADASMREYDVLYTLAKAGEPIRLCKLQDGVLLSQPALSRMVDRLVARGLLLRVTDTADKRAIRISLSEEGQRVQRAIGRAHAKSVARDVGGSLDADELAELQRLCTKLAASAEA